VDFYSVFVLPLCAFLRYFWFILQTLLAFNLASTQRQQKVTANGLLCNKSFLFRLVLLAGSLVIRFALLIFAYFSWEFSQAAKGQINSSQKFCHKLNHK